MWIATNDVLIIQRDYFGAHTFEVLPGKENERFKAGEDIRVSHIFLITRVTSHC